MIPKYLAVKFLEPLTEKLGYNINIIDENGIIIASSDKSREDTFHEAAYKLIKGKQEIAKVGSDDPMLLGVKPGVNLPVHYAKDIIGVVGVTGNPVEVQAVAYAIRTSLETMIEYEFYKDSVFLRQSEKNIFINHLIYEMDYNAKTTEGMATKLGYSTSVYRVPIIAVINGKRLSEELLSLVKKNKLHSNQDISCITIDRNILIFKTVKVKNKNIFGGVKAQVIEYIDELGKILKNVEPSCSLRCYVGNFESELIKYRYAYEQIRWCIDSVRCDEDGIVFFIDNVEKYLLSQIPRKDIFNVFSGSQRLVEEIDKDESLMETVKVVYDCGMNLQKAAAVLGIHRNTVYQRVKRLNELLGIDSISDFNNHQFIYYLLRCYQINRK